MATRAPIACRRGLEQPQGGAIDRLPWGRGLAWEEERGPELEISNTPTFGYTQPAST